MADPIPEMTDEALVKALKEARERFLSQIGALIHAVDNDRLGAMGLVAVDTNGDILVNFITVHPITTLNVWHGLSALLGKVEQRMREDGTWEEAKDDDDDEDDDDLKPEPVAAPAPKLQ